MNRNIFFIGLVLWLGLHLSCANDDGSNSTDSNDQSNPPDENIFCGMEIENLNTQSSIDNFARKEVHGTVHISGGLVQDLEGLSELTFISKLIIENTELTSLNGLQNLVTLCDGQIELVNNPYLEDVSALGNIGNQITALTIKDCPELRDTSGLNMSDDALKLVIMRSGIENVNSFNNLKKLRSLVFENLPNLHSISGFMGVEEIEDIELNQIPLLTNLIGFNDLKAIRYDVDIQNVGIENLNAFTELVSVDSYLNIIGCENLTSLDGLNNLVRVGNKFTIEGCPLIQDFHGLEQLREINDLFVSDLESLNTFSGLSGISALAKLHITTCPQINSLEGLWSLTKVDFVTVGGCSSLTSLQGLQNLEVIQEGIKIYNCAKLENLDVLSNTSGSIAGANPRIELNALPILQSIEGLQHFKANRLIFSSLPSLTTLNGLGDISLLLEMSFDNIGIFDFSGLSNLESIHYVNIKDCASLQSLDGSPVQGDAIASPSSTTYIAFENNTQLSNFCGFTTLANYSPYIEVDCVGNAYNPTLEQIQSSAECSL